MVEEEEEEEEEEEATVKEERGRHEESDTEEEDREEGTYGQDENGTHRGVAGDESQSPSCCPYGQHEKVKWQLGFQKKYSVLHDLGKGRFSVVKRCQRIRDHHEFAAKFVRRGRQEQRLTEVEFLLLRRLRHPALIRPHALYKATEKFDILIMELVIGLPLLDWIFTKEETTESECALLLIKVIEALKYLHSQHIAYLDLKPESILIDIQMTTTNGTTGLLDGSSDPGIQPAIRIIDLGNSRHVESPTRGGGDTTSYGDKISTLDSHISGLRVSSDFPPLIQGSPEFMAPELVTRQSVGIQADYWSLGILIYVLVSGKSPFLGTSPEGTCKNILAGNISYPVEYFNSVTQEACDLTHDLLLQNPLERLNLDGVLSHPWFHMMECESTLPVHSLANFCFRRSKVASSTQEILSSNPSLPPSVPPAVSSSAGI